MDRFWDKVEKTDGCWVWTASKNGDGYGQFRIGSRMCKAHRVAYELEIGQIPDNKEIDHTCRNRACVRPDHLDPVDHAENVRRGNLRSVSSSKTHCPHGHPYDEANTYNYVRDGVAVSRQCRTCMRDHSRKKRAKAAAA